MRNWMVSLLLLMCVFATGCVTLMLPKAKATVDAVTTARSVAWTMGDEDAATYWFRADWHQTVAVGNELSREEIRAKFTDEERAAMRVHVDEIENARKLQQSIGNYILGQAGFFTAPPPLLSGEQAAEELPEISGEYISPPEDRTPETGLAIVVPGSIGELAEALMAAQQPVYRFSSRDLEDMLLVHGVLEEHAAYVTQRIHRAIQVGNPFQTIAPIQTEIEFVVMLEYIYGYLHGMDKVLPRVE